MASAQTAGCYSDITARDDLPLIRLLHLRPAGGKEEPLQARLQVVAFKTRLSFDSQSDAVELHRIPPFEALSYVWGRNIQHRALELQFETPEGEYKVARTDITVNLAVALKHLRYTDRTRILWVDALCINQDDLHEKSAQVVMMNQIYREAERVLIWMGPAMDRSDWVLSHANKISRQHKAQAVNSRKVTEEMEDERTGGNDTPGQKTSQPSTILGDNETFAFARLLNREWYTRAWVIQELCVSKDALVICGDLSAPWDALTLSFKSLEGSSAFGQPSSLLNYGMTRHLALCRLRILSTENQLALPEALVRCRWFRASAPVDKVYALLGIAGDESITPDYTLSPEACFIKTARTILSRSSIPDLLDFVTPTAPIVRRKNLPSWVPDLSPVNVTTQFEVAQTLADAFHLEKILRNPEENRFKPTGHGRPRFDDPSTLVLRGIEIDIVTDLTTPIPGPWLGNAYAIDSRTRPPGCGPDARFSERLADVRVSWDYLAYNLTSFLTIAGKTVDYAATMAHIHELAGFAQSKSKQQAPDTTPHSSPPTDDTATSCPDGSLLSLSTLLLSNSVAALGQHLSSEQQTTAILSHPLTLTSARPSRIYRALLLHRLLPAVLYHTLVALTGIYRLFVHQDRTFSFSIDAVNRLTPYIGYRAGLMAHRMVLCLVPHTTRVGDRIVLVAGGRHPYVFRRVEETKSLVVGKGFGSGIGAWWKRIQGMIARKGKVQSSNNIEERWTLVGPCYVSAEVMNELRELWVEEEAREMFVE